MPELRKFPLEILLLPFRLFFFLMHLSIPFLGAIGYFVVFSLLVALPVFLILQLSYLVTPGFETTVASILESTGFYIFVGISFLLFCYFYFSSEYDINAIASIKKFLDKSKTNTFPSSSGFSLREENGQFNISVFIGESLKVIHTLLCNREDLKVYLSKKGKVSFNWKKAKSENMPSFWKFRNASVEDVNDIRAFCQKNKIYYKG